MTNTDPRWNPRQPSDYDNGLRRDQADRPAPGSDRQQQQQEVERYVEREPARLPDYRRQGE